MDYNGIRVLGYLIQSHAPWKPNKLVVPPWEMGLHQKEHLVTVIRETTLIIQKVQHDT